MQQVLTIFWCVYLHFQEFTWSGTIESHEPIGPGVAGYPNGDSYEGSYYDGKRNSLGKYTFTKSGATYEGNYTNNQKAGFGTMNYPDKSIYTGFLIFVISISDKTLNIKRKKQLVTP